MGMKIIVDTDRCTGHGICESLAPELFEVGNEGIVHLVAEPADAVRTTVKSAVAECPTQALRLEG
jgi:ferredoxin